MILLKCNEMEALWWSRFNYHVLCMFIQQINTYSKLTIETVKKGVKYVKS